MYKFHLISIIILLTISSCTPLESLFSLLHKEEGIILNDDLDEMWLLLSEDYQDHFKNWVRNIKNPEKKKYQELSDLLHAADCVQLDELNGRKFYTFLIKKKLDIAGKDAIIYGNGYIARKHGRHFCVRRLKGEKEEISSRAIIEDGQWKYALDKHKDDLIIWVLSDYNSKKGEEKENYFCDL